jgi:DNA-binding PadR family transcriptional regulator
MRGRCHEGREHRSRHPWGGHGMRGGGGGWERGRGGGGPRGGRIGRLLEHGDLRFVLLAVIEEQPRHGYELIKELEERTGGAYRPSPGVIYPTLSLLEDEGFIRPASPEAARKLFEITPEGRAALEQNRASVDAVFGRMAEAAERSGATGPRVGRAMANLGMALQQRLSDPALTPEALDRIVGLIDETAAAVEKV